MAYTDQKKFHADYYKTDMKHLTKDKRSITVEQAYEFYRETFARKTGEVKGVTVPNFHVFGRHVYQRDDSIKISEYVPDDPARGPGIGAEEFANLPVLLNAGWTMALNDTWLLAGVNSLAEFHFNSEMTWKNILDTTHILTVTGRELAGLVLAGYVQVSTPLEPIFVPGTNKKPAEDLSFVVYDTEVEKLKNEDAVRKFFAGKFTIT
jgi:hypothetical protein